MGKPVIIHSPMTPTVLEQEIVVGISIGVRMNPIISMVQKDVHYCKAIHIGVILVALLHDNTSVNLAPNAARISIALLPRNKAVGF